MVRARNGGAALSQVRLPHVEPGQRVGLFGGSFNPPHEAHLLVSEIALKRLRLDQIWWLVTPGNPLKMGVETPSLDERMAACRVMTTDRRIVIAGFERELGTRYTASTLAFLKRRHSRTHFVWVMGADCLGQFHHWRRWRSIFEMMPVAVVDRPTYHLKALASPAARTFQLSKIDETQARGLAGMPPPAWTFLTGPLSAQSSTRLRVLRARDVQ
ncbi:MAG: nicotinate-nucleotide adenylyltransferase [Hyphomicrobiaceae bacterium]